jgi:hypothetical protein
VTTIIPRETNGLWLALILDREPEDPKWLFVAVLDVRPARLLDGRFFSASLPEVVTWVSELTGHQVDLVPVHQPLAWRVDEIHDNPKEH